MCYSGSFYVYVFVHFIVLIISFFFQGYITVVHLVLFCWFWLRLSCFVRQAFAEARSMVQQKWMQIWVFDLNMCVHQSETWAMAGMCFYHVRMACSFIRAWFLLHALHIHFNIIFFKMGVLFLQFKVSVFLWLTKFWRKIYFIFPTLGWWINKAKQNKFIIKLIACLKKKAY